MKNLHIENFLSIISSPDVFSNPTKKNTRHFFYHIYELFENAGISLSDQIIYYFTKIKKTFELCQQGFLEQAKKCELENSKVLSNFAGVELIIANLLYYPCSAYVDYKDLQYEAAKYKLDKVIDVIKDDLGFNVGKPEFKVKLLAEQELNLFRLNVDMADLEAAKAVLRDLLLLLMNDRKDVEGHEQQHNDFEYFQMYILNGIFSKLILLKYNLQLEYIKAIAVLGASGLPPMLKQVSNLLLYFRNEIHYKQNFESFIEQNDLKDIPRNLLIMLVGQYFNVSHRLHNMEKITHYKSTIVERILCLPNISVGQKEYLIKSFDCFNEVYTSE